VAASVPEGFDLRSIPGVRWSGKLAPDDKIAKTIDQTLSQTHVLVNVFDDVDPHIARTTLRDAGFDVIANPYLGRHTLLAATSGFDMARLAELDMVSYIYPAPSAVIAGKPTHHCAGAMTQYGKIPAFVTNGEGWDGPGKGSFDLKYFFHTGTPDMSGEIGIVVAAFNTWSKYANLSWTQSFSIVDLLGRVDILWGSDSHGDFSPFDGAGNVLAHAFYPNDINPEPIAGDMHFDEDEIWGKGDNIDLFSIALHEAGHSLGLNHSDDPEAVMFAFYSAPIADLGADDVAGIRSIYQEKVVPRAAPPTFDPPPGTYESPLEVRLSYGVGMNANNSQLKYTLDQTEPISYSFDFEPNANDYILQRFSNTIKARAFSSNKTPSEVVEASYTLIPATPTVATPVITPAGGTFTNPPTISMTTTTPSAEIRFTTDGSEPTISSQLYNGSFTLSAIKTVKARAYRDNYSPSQIATENYEIPVQLPTPTIYPDGGLFVGSTVVYLGSSVLGAEIRYTLDGSEPAQTSQLYTTPFTLSAHTILSARVFLDGYPPSAIAAADFVIASDVAQPVFNPQGGVFTDAVQVALSTSTPGAVIRYSTNGAVPTSYSTEYTSPFTLGIGSHTVQAQGFLDGANASSVVTRNFEVYSGGAAKVERPTMSPFSSQQFVDRIAIEMDCRTEGALIRYTVGFGQLPADPTETGAGSITYTGTLNFGTPGFTYFVKVRAFKQGLPPSDIIQSGGLTVNTPVGAVAPVAFSPNGGVFANSVTVTLSTTTSSGQIVFTNDGTPPSVIAPILFPTKVYRNPINIFTPQTITARGFRTFFTPSASRSAEFTFKCATPAINPEGGDFTDNVSVSLTSETTGGNTKIRYTLDGSDPTDQSTEYETVFNLPVGSYSVRAKTFRTGFDDSETAAAEFVVSPTAVAPTITTHPQNQVVDPGDDVTFSVVVAGVPDPQYQWLRNGVELPTEVSASLIIPNVQRGDSGSYRVVVSNVAGAETSKEAILNVRRIVNSVEGSEGALPTAFSLGQNYPNPFNPTTTMLFSLPQNSHVKLDVYNMRGQKVRALLNEERPAGFYEARWNGRDDNGVLVSSGVYLYRIKADGFFQTRKMIFMK